MSLTAFNRLRRMQQTEEMKPENIAKTAEEPKEEKVVEVEPEVTEEVKTEETVEEKPVTEEEKVTASRRRRRTNS